MLTKKQHELDVMKWEKSVAMGADACGTFEFCIKCDKSLENPCDKAFKAYGRRASSRKYAAKKAAKRFATSYIFPRAILRISRTRDNSRVYRCSMTL